MIIALIFSIAFIAFTAISIYQSVSFVKSPIVIKDYRNLILKQIALIGFASVSFLSMSFGFYIWLEATFEAFYIFQLIVGGLFFPLTLLAAINCFIVHFYDKDAPELINKWSFRVIIIGFVSAAIFFFIYTNGLAPFLTYPLINGISFTKGFVTPEGVRPNITFYALCILSGAVLVYFICDHYMYKEYGQHGLLESTFYVAFPAGILGARIWYVIGNWTKEFQGKPFWTVFAVWEGGLTILGGALMGIIVGVIFYLWSNRGRSLFLAIDIIVPCILIAQAVGRLGNYFNCEVHGLLSDVIYWKWLPEIIWRNAAFSSISGFAPSGQIYVPLFFIESVANLLGYFLLSQVFGRLLRKYTELGDLGAGYIVWYGLTRTLMEPLRSAEFQMGEDGYWSWVWGITFVLVGTLLIVLNHVVRHVIKKNKKLYVVKSNAKKASLLTSVIIAVCATAFMSVGTLLMNSNQFVAKVEYNGFNVGLILLVVGISILSLIIVSLIKLFEALKSKDSHAQV